MRACAQLYSPFVCNSRPVCAFGPRRRSFDQASGARYTSEPFTAPTNSLHCSRPWETAGGERRGTNPRRPSGARRLVVAGLPHRERHAYARRHRAVLERPQSARLHRGDRQAARGARAGPDDPQPSGPLQRRQVAEPQDRGSTACAPRRHENPPKLRGAPEAAAPVPEGHAARPDRGGGRAAADQRRRQGHPHARAHAGKRLLSAGGQGRAVLRRHPLQRRGQAEPLGALPPVRRPRPARLAGAARHHGVRRAVRRPRRAPDRRRVGQAQDAAGDSPGAADLGRYLKSIPRRLYQRRGLSSEDY